MGFKADITSEVTEIFSRTWEEQTTATIPAPEDLRLSNHAKNLERATVLYADLDGSTAMVDKCSWSFSAEVYKAYLRCSARIINKEGGTITAYDGDRIMAVFTGDRKNTSAVRAALGINWAVRNVVQPSLKGVYTTTDFVLNHCIGVDTSQLRAARIGVRGDNDLVWIGRAANYAAKLTAIGEKPLWITKAVYDSMNKEVKFAGETNMWEKRLWGKMANLEIYCSSFSWGYD